ncbi:hypothetical protein ACTVZO_05310 [Streptomyces sp. IBSNAI002]|uniref:hypothetical protein n=1 Tax=Streptomyces sp. IBSNAI002 TaxID=3457500 RepID=UPI003FD4AB8D
MSQQPAVHLWEIDHPYYCAQANHYGRNHTSWHSWADFSNDTLFVTGDRDMNYLVRWDWQHDDETAEHTLDLFFVIQRKGYLCSHTIKVTPADEPAIRVWLTECAQTMRATWEPLLDGPGE